MRSYHVEAVSWIKRVKTLDVSLLGCALIALVR